MQNAGKTDESRDAADDSDFFRQSCCPFRTAVQSSLSGTSNQGTTLHPCGASRALLLPP
jgi:hypothetical protein